MLMDSIAFNWASDNIAMTRRNCFGLLLLSLVISGAIAVDDKAKPDESDKENEKTVSKRGVLHYATHGHVHPAVVSSTHYHLPSAVGRYPVLHHHKPHWSPAAPAVHSHLIPTAPHVHSHLVPAAHPHYHIVPGGASVTSYSVNYPRVPLLPRPVVPFYHKHIPAYAPPVVVAAPPAIIPAVHHHPNFHHHSPYVPHYHPTSVAPRPVALPGIRHPKYPIYFQPKPFYTGFHHHQHVPIATPNPTFIPVAVPSQPQPAHPPTAIDSGTDLNSNFAPSTPQFIPQIPMPTQPSMVHRPTLQMPTMTSHGFRPMMMMMTTQNHHPQATQPTFTDKHPPYNYHAPSVAFNHDQPSSTNDIVSGHGQMSGQLAHQLALYQQQQYIQQQQQESRLKQTR